MDKKMRFSNILVESYDSVVSGDPSSYTRKLLDDEDVVQRVNSITNREDVSYFILSNKHKAVFGFMHPISDQEARSDIGRKKDFITTLHETEKENILRADLGAVLRQLNNHVPKSRKEKIQNKIDIDEKEVTAGEEAFEFGLENVARIYNGLKSPPLTLPELSRASHFHLCVSRGVENMKIVVSEKIHKENSEYFNTLIELNESGGSARDDYGFIRQDEVEYLQSMGNLTWESLPTSEDIKQYRIDNIFGDMKTDKESINNGKQSIQMETNEVLQQSLEKEIENEIANLKSLSREIIDNPQDYRKSGMFGRDTRTRTQLVEDTIEKSQEQFIEDKSSEIAEKVQKKVKRELQDIMEKHKTQIIEKTAEIERILQK